MWDKGPVAQGVASRLQDMIRSGQLKAGQKLPSQRILSEQLQVSRPTLREALMTLETLGLIQTLPARGTFVLDPASHAPRTTWRYDDAHDLRDVFQTRLLVEGEMCRLAAAMITPAAVASLTAAADAFEDAWHRRDLVAHVEADLALHQGIADACPNRVLASVYGNLKHLLSETQRQPIPNTDPGRMAQSISEHRLILAALANRDPEAACRRMQEHVRNTARCAGHDL
ncbi:FadR/GntR family transcriptional regulator [Paracoccus sp. WLY502]|uniref:FadR/GntR family transcriptional regulator n=1 Tax=Paracoccus yibinensis TaxID=3068891 RepID=UPI002796519A|nr:FadR/GntR family transcriptional regulator [Paracoccus sp. WLY502]MDQ1902669.1 FadR/GntR family transcriptional regulator [Paracoccus sp. WLY502]